MIRDFVTTYPEVFLYLFGLISTLAMGATGLWIKTMKKKIEEHIVKEEGAIFPKMDERFNRLEGRFHNLELNLSNRMTGLEARIPNGDIGEIKGMLKVLIADRDK